MATSPLDIVSVEEIKQEFDLPATHISEDAKLARHISQAVETTARITGLPLIDVPLTLFADFPERDADPLKFYGRDIVFDADSDKIQYWSDGHSLDIEPDTTLDNIGRSVATKAGIVIYRTTGWPDDVEPGTRAMLSTKTGIAEIPDGIKSSIIILARHLYGGFEKLPAAYGDLVSPYRRVTPEEVE